MGRRVCRRGLPCRRFLGQHVRLGRRNLGTRCLYAVVWIRIFSWGAEILAVGALGRDLVGGGAISRRGEGCRGASRDGEKRDGQSCFGPAPSRLHVHGETCVEVPGLDCLRLHAHARTPGVVLVNVAAAGLVFKAGDPRSPPLSRPPTTGEGLSARHAERRRRKPSRPPGQRARLELRLALKLGRTYFLA